MSQNREPPAYQEYAASMLSKMDFRILTMAQRGLLYTMRLECWVNKEMPADVETLSVILGQPVAGSDLDAVMPFFSLDDGFLRSLELDSYRAHLEQIKQKQIEGGKEGQRRKQNKAAGRKNAGGKGALKGDLAGKPEGDLEDASRSLVQSSSGKSSTEKTSNHGEGYFDEHGDDPLAADLCPRCDGEGCKFCQPGRQKLKAVG